MCDCNSGGGILGPNLRSLRTCLCNLFLGIHTLLTKPPNLGQPLVTSVKEHSENDCELKFPFLEFSLFLFLPFGFRGQSSVVGPSDNTQNLEQLSLFPGISLSHFVCLTNSKSEPGSQDETKEKKNKNININIKK